MGIAGRFPYNQLRFAETCLMHGFDVGLLDELRFIPDPEAIRDDGPPTAMSVIR